MPEHHAMRRCGAAIEQLERRQFFAATATALAAEPAAPFIAKINFQPANAPAYAGYDVDSGSAYGNRGNGLTYGWSSINNKTSDRNSSLSSDQRYDTLNRIQSSTLTWDLAVPNGRYVVKLVSGDPIKYDSYYKSSVEGQTIIDGQPTSTNRWVSGTATVDVTDGRLTLRNVSGASNNKVNFIEVYQTDLPTSVTIGPENSSGFTRSGSADFLLRPSGSTTGISRVEFFNGGIKIGEDTSAPFGLYYKNVDVGTYSITTRMTSTSGSTTTSAPVPLTVNTSVVGLLTIGGSSSNQADRMVGWNIKTAGWSGFVAQVIQPQLAWGARRILLLNPFGIIEGQPMQFDQYLHAKDSGLTWLTSGFAQAWKPVTASGVEVIAYLGNMEGDPDFSGSNWQQRFWDSVKPALDAGMSIGLDGAGDASLTSKTYQAAQMLRNLGAKVYIEARPRRENTHWHDYGVISNDYFWDRSNPDYYGDATWAAPDSMLRGEIIRMITFPPYGKDWNNLSWLQPYGRDILQQGHTVALGFHDLIRGGITLEDLMA